MNTFSISTLLFLSLFSPRPSVSDWVAFGGGYSHTGYRAETLSKFRSFRLLWNVTLAAQLNSPVISQQYVYVSSSTNNTIWVLQPDSGEIVRRIDLGQVAGTGAPTLGPNEILYVQTFDSEEVSTAMRVHAFNIEKDFDKLWESHHESIFTEYDFGLVCSYDGVYTQGGPRKSNVEGYAAKDGKLMFSTRFNNSIFNNYTFGNDNWAPALSNDGRLLFSSTGFLGEIDIQSGELLWVYNFTSWIGQLSADWTPVIFSENIVVGTFFRTFGWHYDFFAVKLSENRKDLPQVLWVSQLNCNVATGFDTDRNAAIDESEEKVYVACNDAIYRLDLLTGQLGPKYLHCDSCYGQPIVLADYVIARSDLGFIIVFNKESAEIVQKFETGKRPSWFAYDSQKLFISADDDLLAYKVSTNDQ